MEFFRKEGGFQMKLVSERRRWGTEPHWHFRKLNAVVQEDIVPQKSESRETKKLRQSLQTFSESGFVEAGRDKHGKSE